MAQHGLMVSRGQLAEIMSRARNAMRRGEALKERSEHVINTSVDALVTSGAAFGLGLARGRMGGRAVLFGVPVELGVGVMAHLAGFTGIVGKASGHAHSIGNGALAAYAYGMGHDAGKSWRSKSGGGAPSRFVKIDGMAGNGGGGRVEESGGGGLSDDALADLAQRA